MLGRGGKRCQGLIPQEADTESFASLGPHSSSAGQLKAKFCSSFHHSERDGGPPKPEAKLLEGSKSKMVHNQQWQSRVARNQDAGSAGSAGSKKPGDQRSGGSCTAPPSITRASDTDGVEVQRGFAPSDIAKDPDKRDFLTHLSRKIFSNPSNGPEQQLLARKRSLSACRQSESRTSHRGSGFHHSLKVLYCLFCSGYLAI